MQPATNYVHMDVWRLANELLSAFLLKTINTTNEVNPLVNQACLHTL
jgi:hypothetical protein